MYRQKYLKYHRKYLDLKKMIGGSRLVKMPQLCFGTVHHNLEVTLPLALKLGYRHIDGAQNYGGQEYKNIIKKVIKVIPRNQLWITWKDNNITEEKIKIIIEELDCEYIDLFLVHHSCGTENDFIEFKKAQDDCLITYYGISNCENIDTIRKLKNQHNIYANQVQARPPKGKINGRPNSNPENFYDFVNECNKIDVNIMLFSTINAIYGAMDSEENLKFYDKIAENNDFLNQYYIQKYIFEKNNILLVGSTSGSGITKTMYDFHVIKTNRLELEKMNEIEDLLEKLVLELK